MLKFAKFIVVSPGLADTHSPSGRMSPRGFNVLQKEQLPIKKSSHDDLKNLLANRWDWSEDSNEDVPMAASSFSLLVLVHRCSQLQVVMD